MTAMWEKPRHEKLRYPYYIPAFQDVMDWWDKEPTLTDVSPMTICPGCVASGAKDLWIVMNVTVLDPDRVDVHWAHFDKDTGTLKHEQQVFARHNRSLWSTALYTLDKRPVSGYCPHCNTRLEWAACAERCPNCWWVKA